MSISSLNKTSNQRLRKLLLALCFAFPLARATITVHQVSSAPPASSVIPLSVDVPPAPAKIDPPPPGDRPQVDAPSAADKYKATILEQARNFGARIADTFTCAPGIMDTQYSTQSWYLMDSITGWNNSVARSSLPDDATFDANAKQAFIEAAERQIAARDVELKDSPQIANYLKHAAATAGVIFERALAKREIHKDVLDLNHAAANVPSTDGQSVFRALRTAHATHFEDLESKTCTQIGKNFWGRPRFDFPTSTESKARVTEIDPPKKPRRVAATTSDTNIVHRRGASGGSSSPLPLADPGSVSSVGHTASRTRTRTTAQQQRESAPLPLSYGDLDRKYTPSKKISATLPYVAYEDRHEAGYQTYYGNNGNLWGRPQTIRNILKAARTLSAQGIYIGVGDINRSPTKKNDEHVDTEGHHSHNEGRAADFRLIGPDGDAHRCTISQPSCYDRNKTFLMVKALIDADPSNVQVIYNNDAKLRAMIADYLVKIGYSRAVANSIPRYFANHDNHVHFHWKT